MGTPAILATFGAEGLTNNAVEEGLMLHTESAEKGLKCQAQKVDY